MRKVLFLAGCFGWGCLDIGKILLNVVVLPVLITLGILTLLDIIWLDGPFPKPQPIALRERHELEKIPQIPATYDSWDRLNLPLRYLDKCLPEASAWVRERHMENKITFKPAESVRYIAMYNVPFHRLSISEIFFTYNTAFQASTLAHEFYHSRQGSICRLKHTVALLFGINSDSFVEWPAYRYGDTVYEAITKGS